MRGKVPKVLRATTKPRSMRASRDRGCGVARSILSDFYCCLTRSEGDLRLVRVEEVDALIREIRVIYRFELLQRGLVTPGSRLVRVHWYGECRGTGKRLRRNGG
jgi:hypothetical protein